MYNLHHNNFITAGNIIYMSIVLIVALYCRGAVPLQEALMELNEDPPEDSGTDRSDIEDLG